MNGMEEKDVFKNKCYANDEIYIAKSVQCSMKSSEQKYSMK